MHSLRNLGLTTTLFLLVFSACKKDNPHPLVERTVGTHNFSYQSAELGFTYDSLGNPIDFGYIQQPETSKSASIYQEPGTTDGIMLDELLGIPEDSITARVDGDTLRISAQTAGYSSGGTMTISGKLYWKSDSLIIQYSWSDPGWFPEPDGGGTARGAVK